MREQRGGIISKLAAMILLLVVLVVLYLLRFPLLRMAGEFWVVSESPETSDAIVVLSPDSYAAERAARAAELYREGWAPRIVASGNRLRPYFNLADLMQRDLVERGVPSQAVIRFPQSAENTREEARVLRELATERGWQRVLIVTSNFHTRRTRYIFRRVFPRAVEVRVVAARDSGYDPYRWWETRLGRKLFFLEAVGLCVAAWELWKYGPEPADTPGSTHPEPRRQADSLSRLHASLPVLYCPRLHFVRVP